MVTLSGKPAPRLRVLVLAVLAVLASLVVAGPPAPAAAATAAAAGVDARDDGAAVPPRRRPNRQRLRGHAGAGGRRRLCDAPVATETHIAGVYADVPDRSGGIQRQGSVKLPAGRSSTWSSAASASRPRAPATARCSTCAAAWSRRPRPGRPADGRPGRYDVALDRAAQRVGLVRLRLTPRWSGSLQVRDVLGAGARLTPAAAAGQRSPRRDDGAGGRAHRRHRDHRGRGRPPARAAGEQRGRRRTRRP